MLISGTNAFSNDRPLAETKITNFIKQFYNDENGDVIKVKYDSFPAILKEKVRIKNIGFAKVPDINGDGLCMVDIQSKTEKNKSVYVAFKILRKKSLFVLKKNIRKGDYINKNDIMIRDTYLYGNNIYYPSKMEEVSGRAFKRDVSAGTTVTFQLLEEPASVQRGEIVTIVAENKKLIVQAKGKTLEKGKIGDVIRVKNLSSNREIAAKVIGSNTVRVDL